MGERIGRGQRRYENQDYEDSPYAAPLALRAVRASVVRRRNPVTAAADTVIARINEQIEGRGRDKAAPTPPAEGKGLSTEELTEEVQPLPRRKLGGAAIEAAQDKAA